MGRRKTKARRGERIVLMGNVPSSIASPNQPSSLLSTSLVSHGAHDVSLTQPTRTFAECLGSPSETMPAPSIGTTSSSTSSSVTSSPSSQASAPDMAVPPLIDTLGDNILSTPSQHASMTDTTSDKLASKTTRLMIPNTQDEPCHRGISIRGESPPSFIRAVTPPSKAKAHSDRLATTENPVSQPLDRLCLNLAETLQMGLNWHTAAGILGVVDQIETPQN
eukprot:TRINITY_DN5585_c0_g1_i2.p1 TRINITY_DN5585_c0_g1~~TRINITY_DN5585_c0_g1_i2.p1  ORF type:complete len:221 (+),score=24.41 TRINITY_DN5585_c0_g1_i2:154-816(+)